MTNNLIHHKMHSRRFYSTLKFNHIYATLLRLRFAAINVFIVLLNRCLHYCKHKSSYNLVVKCEFDWVMQCSLGGTPATSRI